MLLLFSLIVSLINVVILIMTTIHFMLLLLVQCLGFSTTVLLLSLLPLLL